ncbi:helix-turn-helix transcriptional regulator [Chitiniphilus eburneus]|uniref:Helix-turn-helix transcriptional regulator n=1 Tax=Chitiniphilus eburneus TaxID=2571148 RepID=A0A4V5MNW1_9NEIS|nr:AraC family transcriptional regulator [Chitiniphilus eburneus]TJZ66398.1 helix-turn-helix transcriptional regulator [Chitiniphilus eburneus]
MSTIYQELFEAGPRTRQLGVGARIFHHPHLRALGDYDMLLAGFSEARDSLHVERVGAPFHVVLVSAEGEGEVIDGEQRLPVGPGQLAVLPALGHSGFRMTGTEWRIAWFLLNDAPSWPIAAAGPAQVRPVRDAETLFHAVAALCLEARRDHESLSAGALVLVADLLKRMLDSSEAGDAQAAALRALFDDVTRAPDADWRVATLAARHGVSTAHFQRLCLKHLGHAPQRLIVARRMARARELLLAGWGNVGQVAAAVGYQEIASFSRRFSAHFGLNPCELLRHLQRAPKELPFDPG